MLHICRGVAISRIMDDKHHPSDVVGGAFLGTIIACAFLARAIPRHQVVMDTDDLKEPLLNDEQRQPSALA